MSAINIIETYHNVLKSIEEAAIKGNRDPNEITLITVSKTQPVELIYQLYQEGCRNFGENKVQELVAKYEQLPKDIKWHMIGHLQRNKVKYIIDKVCFIHSVDSFSLAEEIDRQAKKHNLIMNILIEVNIAREDSKFGVLAEDTDTLVKEIATLSNVVIKGFMTVAPYVDNSLKNKQYFVKLNELSVDINRKNIDNTSIDVLSMGMTNDYEIAIEEGASMVRVGSGIFGERIISIEN